MAAAVLTLNGYLVDTLSTRYSQLMDKLKEGEDDDEEEEEAVHRERPRTSTAPEEEMEDFTHAIKERRARARLQRARLYGCGARAKIPKVKVFSPNYHLIMLRL